MFTPLEIMILNIFIKYYILIIQNNGQNNLCSKATGFIFGIVSQ